MLQRHVKDAVGGIMNVSDAVGVAYFSLSLSLYIYIYNIYRERYVYIYMDI